MSSCGIIGLGTMGRNLCLNLAEKGFKLSLFNRHLPGIEENVANNFINQHQLQNAAQGFDQLDTFVRSIPVPRIVLLLIPAGNAVSSILGELIPLMQPGDILMDCGNSHFKDTERRMETCKELGIEYFGVGISGGEEGARTGPAVMPGGNPDAYPLVAPVLEAVAAKNPWGNPCCLLIGSGGSGHFVKMVHNGIEYAEMQLLAEVFSAMHQVCQLTPAEIVQELEYWQETELQSYLLGITCNILRHTTNGALTLDTILDKAAQNGTGNWTTIAACELGVPVPTLTAALFARFTSMFKQTRVQADLIYNDYYPTITAPSLPTLRKVYGIARLINHIQGFQLIEAASLHYGWGIKSAEVAAIWTNGCILQSRLMQEFVGLLEESEINITHPKIVQALKPGIPEFGAFLSNIIPGHLPLPCMESAWTYLKSLSQAESPANLIQAQRDYFGAHTYQRRDNPQGPAIHTIWKKNPS